MFIASRSLDWCPYCMRQMIQLQQYSADFTAAGIGMVAITYDTPRLQQAFYRQGLVSQYPCCPILMASVSKPWVFSTRVPTGDVQYGIPYPA